jgi:hypothetical protein
MDNQEQRNEEANQPSKKGAPGQDQKTEKNFNTEENLGSDEVEINPSKLDRDEVDLDRGGVNAEPGQKGHEPYEFGSGQRPAPTSTGGAGGAKSASGSGEGYGGKSDFNKNKPLRQ